MYKFNLMNAFLMKRLAENKGVDKSEATKIGIFGGYASPNSLNNSSIKVIYEEFLKLKNKKISLTEKELQEIFNEVFRIYGKAIAESGLTKMQQREIDKAFKRITANLF